MGRMQRVKGQVWERAVAALFRAALGLGADVVKRGWQARDGREASDVQGTPFWIECKHQRLCNAQAALRQAEEATDGRPPVAVCKDNRGAPFVVMRLNAFLALVGRAHGPRKDVFTPPIRRRAAS